MPETGEHPHHQNIDKLPSDAFTVPSHRDVDIIPEPASQGNVPPAPKLRNAGRNIRVIEIFRKGEPKHSAQPDGHITVS